MPTAESYDATYFASLYGKIPNQTWADRARDRRVAHLVRTFGPQTARGGSLLDIGCGYGYLLEHFRGHFTLYGTDISSHATEKAQARLRDAHVAVADVQERLPFPGPFQVVLAVNVLEHLSQPEVAARVIHDRLAPGGLFVIHLPTINNLLSAWFYARSYARDVTHVYRPSGDAIRNLLHSAGFQPLWESYSPHWPRTLCNRLKPHPAYLAAFRRP
ncbi:MAG: class I SAM-dependent methyltransferase [Anaerolineae bacterium]|nr:class I SAM-dependent methyltransferase [Anaerolineae bacterium]